MVRGSNTGRGTRKCANRLWGPQSHLFNGYRDSFAGVKRPRVIKNEWRRNFTPSIRLMVWTGENLLFTYLTLPVSTWAADTQRSIYWIAVDTARCQLCLTYRRFGRCFTEPECSWLRISSLHRAFRKITSTVNQQMQLYNFHLKHLKPHRHIFRSFQIIIREFRRSLLKLLRFHDLVRFCNQGVVARNDETPWWWSEKIEICRSGFKCLKVF